MWGHRMWRGYHRCRVQKRLRQKQSDGILGPGVAALSTDFRNSVDVMTLKRPV